MSVIPANCVRLWMVSPGQCRGGGSSILSILPLNWMGPTLRFLRAYGKVVHGNSAGMTPSNAARNTSNVSRSIFMPRSCFRDKVFDRICDLIHIVDARIAVFLSLGALSALFGICVADAFDTREVGTQIDTSLRSMNERFDMAKIVLFAIGIISSKSAITL